jgi:hypothetical protein
MERERALISRRHALADADADADAEAMSMQHAA